MSTPEQRIEKIEEAKTLHSVYRKLRLLHYNGYRVFTQPRPKVVAHVNVKAVSFGHFAAPDR